MQEDRKNKIVKNLFSALTVALIAASFLVFHYSLKAQLTASIFEGVIEGEGDDGVPYGLCLEDGSPEDERCNGVDCSLDTWATDTRCISQAEAGTAFSKQNLNETGLTHTDNVGHLIVKYLNFLLPYLALAAFIAFVVAGFFYVTAFGNEEQLTKSKKIMIWAAVGLIIVIISYTIVQFLTSGLVDFLSEQ